MTAEEVRTLPTDRQIQIMEAIWEDFRDRFERSEIFSSAKAVAGPPPGEGPRRRGTAPVLGRGEGNPGQVVIPVQISEDAQEDLNKGFLFYEAQEPGLGDYFVACLRADIEGLKVSGGVHRVIYADYHRMLSKIFPYGVFYTIEGGSAVVWAVLDLRRDPERIRKQLRD